ncbi:MAG: tyrosine-type recombinase/integrase [Solirubrobacterales bacterium]
MAEGIVKRHSKSCASRVGERCRCAGGYEASVYSARDRRKVRKTFKHEAEAKSWRAEAKRALDHGTLRAPSRRTLLQAAETWLEGAERGEIRNRSGRPYKPATLRGYRQALDHQILPTLGSRKLNAVTTSDLQALVDGWQAEGRAASTVRNSIKPLQAIYRRARSREGLAINPTSDLELPAPTSTEVEIVAPRVAARLLDVLPVEDRAIWATALYAGLRYGELRALRWSAVDMAKGVIEVRESWDPKVGSIDPKTRKSRRKVPIPGLLRDLLLDQRMRRGEPSDDSLVFAEEDQVPFQAERLYWRADRAWGVDSARRACLQRFGALDPKTFERRGQMVAGLGQEGHPQRAIAGALGLSTIQVRDILAKLPQREGIVGSKPLARLRLHQARHTYASFMIAAGVNAKALSVFMGHSSITVTFDLYGHLMPGTEAEGAALLDAFLGAQIDVGEQAARAAV